MDTELLLAVDQGYTYYLEYDEEQVSSIYINHIQKDVFRDTWDNEDNIVDIIFTIK